MWHQQQSKAPASALIGKLKDLPAKLLSADVREELATLPGAWVVGGSVRDFVMYGASEDLDLVIDGDPGPVAKKIARKCHAATFELSDQFPCWRVVLPQGAGQIDIARLRGGSIEADLQLRDFTLNAIAVSRDGEVCDPTGGIGDLERGLLRSISEQAYAEDPLRVLRLARLVCQHNFKIDPEAIEQALRHVQGLGEVSGERVFTELKLLICSERPLVGIDLIDRTGALAVVLPELEALKGIEQTPYHHLDAYGHTIEVLEKAVELERSDQVFGSSQSSVVKKALKGELGDSMNQFQVLRFAALFHDLGKASTKAVTEEGRVTFIGHDKVGKQICEDICARLKASRAFTRFVSNLTLNHLHLGFLVHSAPLTREAIYHYITSCEPFSEAVTVLTVADRLATHSERVKPEAIEEHIKLANELLEEIDRWRKRPEPLLGGDQLIDQLGIDKGPLVGQLLSEIDQAQFVGQVSNDEQALEFCRQRLADLES